MSFYIGLISGTSVDGIDAVLVSIKNQQINLVNAASIDYDKALFDDILKLSNQTHVDIVELGELNIRLGLAFSDAALNVLGSISPDQVVAIGSHGQTIQHRPDGDYPFTSQLGCGATIAQATGIKTVTDFRSNDIAAGGQGAPLAPLLHQHCFKATNENRAIINIGGIANLTYLSKTQSDQCVGFDCGPGNGLIDHWATEHLNTPYDDKGEWARAGKPDEALLTHLLADPYFKKSPPKSTGKEYFNVSWLKQYFDISSAHPQNTQSTLTHLTAITIADCVNGLTQENDAVYICGGGAKNLFLIELIERYCSGRKVSTTEELGIDPDFVEAIAFAWLAKSRIEETALDTAPITGASHPVILGAVYLA